MSRVALLARDRPTHSPRRQHTGDTSVRITSLVHASPRPWAPEPSVSPDYIAFEDSDEGEEGSSDDGADGEASVAQLDAGALGPVDGVLTRQACAGSTSRASAR